MKLKLEITKSNENQEMEANPNEIWIYLTLFHEQKIFLVKIKRFELKYFPSPRLIESPRLKSPVSYTISPLQEGE